MYLLLNSKKYVDFEFSVIYLALHLKYTGWFEIHGFQRCLYIIQFYLTPNNFCI